jgi:hypothetical protein
MVEILHFVDGSVQVVGGIVVNGAIILNVEVRPAAISAHS